MYCESFKWPESFGLWASGALLVISETRVATFLLASPVRFQSVFSHLSEYTLTDGRVLPQESSEDITLLFRTVPRLPVT